MNPSDVIQRILGIALLRAGPQDLPYSTGLMGTVIALTAAVNYPVIQRYTPEAEPLAQIGLLVAYNLGFLLAALSLRGHGPRFVQTASALFGSDIVISAVALPILLVIGRPDEANALAALAFLALLIWNIAVVRHILSAALALGGLASLATSLAYIFGASAFVRALTGG